MYILGINAYHGDAAAAIIKDGKLLAAAEEERFNRIKHCAGFPTQAVRYCLKAAGIGIEDVDHIGISRDPSAHLHKKILFTASRAAKQTVGSRQTPVGSAQNSVLSTQHSELSTQHSALSTQHSEGNGHNGKGRGIFSQIKDRLANAAKVRDLKTDLARALEVDAKDIRAQFHNIEH